VYSTYNSIFGAIDPEKSDFLLKTLSESASLKITRLSKILVVWSYVGYWINTTWEMFTPFL